jgi:hypothetical protein
VSDFCDYGQYLPLPYAVSYDCTLLLVYSKGGLITDADKILLLGEKKRLLVSPVSSVSKVGR